MADRNDDEYQSVNFYAKHTKAKDNGFSKFVVDKDFYFCRYVDGDIAMLSQAYTSAAGRDNGIESVKKNAKIAKRFKFDTRARGRHGFSLRAGNGQEIAISPDYTSLAKAEHVSGRMSGAVKRTSPAKKAAPKPKAAAKPKAASKPKVAAKPKTKTKNVEQNYMPVAAYRKATKGKKVGFESFKGDDGEYYFTYFENSKLALISEGYPTAAVRDKGLASVRKNMKVANRYVYGKGADGKDGFILRAGNHKEIARSVGYGSAAAAATGAAYLIGTRRRATVKKATPKPVAKKVVKAAPKPKPKPKPVKKTRKTVKPLAAGAVAVAGLGAAAASAKVNTVKKKAVPVKAPPMKAAPVAVPPVAPPPVSAPPVAAPVMAAAAAPVAAAAKVAAAPPAAAVATGGGIWGWLKWLLLALLALLAMLFLFKACAGGEKAVKAAPVVTTTTSSTAAIVTCWNGDTAQNEAACPAKITCWDNSVVTQQSACPVQPPAKNFECWDGSLEVDAASCPIKPVAKAPVVKTPIVEAVVKPRAPSVAGRICGPSSQALFNVASSSPKSIPYLGSNPQFGNSLSLTPDGFYRKLSAAYQAGGSDRAFLNVLARSLGYGSFRDMDASMFSNDTLPRGTAGLLGFGSSHALQFSALDVTDPTHLEAFKVRSANGTDVHFMKRCGNYMYVCQP